MICVSVPASFPSFLVPHRYLSPTLAHHPPHHAYLDETACFLSRPCSRRVDLTAEGDYWVPAPTIMTDTWSSAVPNRLGGASISSLYSAGSGVSNNSINIAVAPFQSWTSANKLITILPHGSSSDLHFHRPPYCNHVVLQPRICIRQS